MKLKVINRVLLALIVLINGYVIVAPFWPQASYRVQRAFSEPIQLETNEQKSNIDRSYDHVIIPDIALDQKIWFGDNEWLVNKGVWHIPGSSTPDRGSNTVLVGHRWLYKNPEAAVFYHLDKVKTGQRIIVVHEGKLYNYKVSETKVVEPSAVEIEDATEDSRLTLYTCTPLWSTKQRLVIVASLETTDE